MKFVPAATRFPGGLLPSVGVAAIGPARSASDRALRDGPGRPEANRPGSTGPSSLAVRSFGSCVRNHSALQLAPALLSQPGCPRASIFEALEEAFWHIGGVTKMLWVDNPRAFVLDVCPRHFGGISSSLRCAAAIGPSRSPASPCNLE